MPLESKRGENDRLIERVEVAFLILWGLLVKVVNFIRKKICLAVYFIIHNNYITHKGWDKDKDNSIINHLYVF